jgi:hypothetical protein
MPGLNVTLENAREMEAQFKHSKEVRYAQGAINDLADKTTDQIREEVGRLEPDFGGKKDIVSAFQGLVLFAKSTDKPEALLTAIKEQAGKFVEDSPTPLFDSTWEDVKKLGEVTARKGAGFSNIASQMWEETTAEYMRLNGEYPQTKEEKASFEAAKARFANTKVS